MLLLLPMCGNSLIGSSSSGTLLLLTAAEPRAALDESQAGSVRRQLVIRPSDLLPAVGDGESHRRARPALRASEGHGR